MAKRAVARGADAHGPEHPAAARLPVQPLDG